MTHQMLIGKVKKLPKSVHCRKHVHKCALTCKLGHRTQASKSWAEICTQCVCNYFEWVTLENHMIGSLDFSFLKSSGSAGNSTGILLRLRKLNSYNCAPQWHGQDFSDAFTEAHSILQGPTIVDRKHVGCSLSNQWRLQE